MAVDDSTLAAEVRTLTDYDSALISDADLLGVIELAKSELRAEVDDEDMVFYSGNLQADRALFWLVCIFLKIKSGELDAPNLSIGELKLRQAGMGQRTGIWFQRFNQRLDAIATPRMGHTKVSRPDRTYNFEN